MTKEQLVKQKEANQAKIEALESELKEFKKGLKLIDKALAKQDKHEREMAELIPPTDISTVAKNEDESDN